MITACVMLLDDVAVTFTRDVGVNILHTSYAMPSQHICIFIAARIGCLFFSSLYIIIFMSFSLWGGLRGTYHH